MQLDVKTLYPNYYLEDAKDKKERYQSSCKSSGRDKGGQHPRRGMQRAKSAFLKRESAPTNSKSNQIFPLERESFTSSRKKNEMDFGGIRPILRHGSSADRNLVKAKVMKDTRSDAISGGFDRIGISPIRKHVAVSNLARDKGREWFGSRNKPLMNASRSMPNLHIRCQPTVPDHEESSFFLTEPKASMLEKYSAMAQALALGSVLLYGYNRVEEANSIWRNALDCCQPQYNVQLSALLYHHIGISYREDSLKLEDALHMQKQCLRLSIQCDDTRLMARAHKTLGAIYLDKEDIPRSSWHQNTALELALQAGDMELEGRIRANLGNLAIHEDDMELALNSHKRDLELASTKYLNSSVAQARAHQNLTIVYKKLQQMDHAHHHEKLAKAYGKSAFLVDIKHHIHDAIGNIHAQISNSSSSALTFAVAHALEALGRITDKSSDPTLITLQDIAYEQSQTLSS
uniref:Tetratricopeptide repeat protein 29 n=1 Tax=Albugo laibachii Nc14 TaxID=890382 RepID=F0WZW7_9STRA|nr:conserved hypothetical protein [Albugo laibachii Nc14]|eukprot:CCA27046.1 conserved hypothetical protein [Albugo laibachii Nc14]